MARYIDLHMHSTFSDGTSTPAQLLGMVKDSRLAAFAITDHDTLLGYENIVTQLSDSDPELIPGVELSVTHENSDMHILAYLVDPDHPGLKAALDGFQQHRRERGKVMVDKLNALGVSISYADVEKQADGAVVGRPHVARAMYDRKSTGYYEEAFDRYIGYDGPAYVPKSNFTPAQAIELIHAAGGLAVLAHPAIDNKEKYLDMLVELGLDGIEVYHSFHSRPHIDRYKHLAQRYRLLATGGSDFHGADGRYDMIGNQKVPYEYLERMKAKKK